MMIIGIYWIIYKGLESHALLWWSQKWRGRTRDNVDAGAFTHKLVTIFFLQLAFIIKKALKGLKFRIQVVTYDLQAEMTKVKMDRGVVSSVGMSFQFAWSHLLKHHVSFTVA